MFDPKIALKHHIALLVAQNDAKEFVEFTRGISHAIGKIIGQVIVLKLTESKRIMRENKMWIDEVPVHGRYRYSFYGHRGEYEIPQAELDLHISMILSNFEQELKQLQR